VFPVEYEEAARRLAAYQPTEELAVRSDIRVAGAERVRASILKLSEGILDRLDWAIQRALDDTRDVMIMAGFGNDLRAHIK
jgi:hypothetical protein